MESVSPYTTRAFHVGLASTMRMAFSKVSLADCTAPQHTLEPAAAKSLQGRRIKGVLLLGRTGRPSSIASHEWTSALQHTSGQSAGMVFKACA